MKRFSGLIIILFFIFGVIVGQVETVRDWCDACPDASFYVLCVLMFFVGFGVGGDTDVLGNLRGVNPRLLLLPLVTVAGTLAGVAAVSLFFPERRLADCLAIGSGFGYYSLSSIFITEYRGAELGTVALLANIMRELMVMLAAPLLVRCFGRLAPISAAGATSMDTTLPVIMQASGSGFVILSVFHGFVVDFSVPFLVTFFCML